MPTQNTSNLANRAVLLLLKASTALHLHHLRAVGYDEHKVLEQAYNKATESADSIAEQALGARCAILNEVPNTSLQTLDALVQNLREVSEQMDDPVLKNKLEEVVGEFSQIQYLLRMAVEPGTQGSPT